MLYKKKSAAIKKIHLQTAIFHDVEIEPTVVNFFEGKNVFLSNNEDVECAESVAIFKGGFLIWVSCPCQLQERIYLGV